MSAGSGLDIAGWTDILIANDGQPNRLWINRHNGTFTEEAVARGVAFNRMGQAEAGMGVAVGDVNGDDFFDIVISHLTHETLTLWSQYPRGMFNDRTGLTGLARPRWRGTGFGAVLADFDQDGGLDLAVVNGRIMKTEHGPKKPASHWDAYVELNQLFANEENSGSFRDISVDNPALCGTPNVARGLAYGDVDGDGAADLLITTVGAPARLYRNIAPQRGHWLLVRTVDPALGGRDAYGAEVRVRAGKRSSLALMNPASSYLCSNDVRGHFGLGPTKRFDSIEVRWPDGGVEVFAGGDTDRKLVLRRGEGRMANR